MLSLLVALSALSISLLQTSTLGTPADVSRLNVNVASNVDALVPAWTMDGSRLAWAQKSGRTRYTLMYATVSRN